MYIEASLPRISGDKAILKSPAFTAQGQCTLNFWYTMYGRTVADLNVHLVNETGQFVVSNGLIICGLQEAGTQIPNLFNIYLNLAITPN